MLGLFTAMAIAALMEPQPAVRWQTSYPAAYRQARATNRPLFVVAAFGADGWKFLTGNQPWAPATIRKLQEQYICVYLDRNLPEANATALELGVGGEPLLVISSKDLQSKLVRRSGYVSSSDLARLVDAPEAAPAQAVHRANYHDPAQALTPNWSPGPAAGCNT